MVQEILSNLLLSGMTLAATYVLYYIRKATAKVKAEAAKIQNEEQRKLVETAITRLDDVAGKTVRSIEQTTAAALREAVKDGTVSRDELTALSGQAYQEIIHILNPAYLSVLEESLGDLQAYITHTIEAKVLELKEAA